MTLLGMPIERAAYFFGWGNLILFSQHLPMDSATMRALHPDETGFASDLKRAALLADLFDLVSAFNYVFAKAHGYHGQKPKPYPRPWSHENERHVGRDPIPISEFDAWYYGGDE